MKRFIAFSGGVESSTMCVLYGGVADAIFSDTGFEHEEIYKRIELVESRVREIHDNNFKVHRVQAKSGTLEDYIHENKYYPSFRSRYCTRLFKIEPIDDFLREESAGGVELMIGLNADEAERRVGNLGAVKNVSYTYPLVENGITREACRAILQKSNLYPEFPPYMQRGGCVGCFYKSKKEYALMLEMAPKEYKRVEDLEHAIQDERGKFYTVIQGMRGGFTGFRERIESQGKLFDIEPEPQGHTQCGIFCNR